MARGGVGRTPLPRGLSFAWRGAPRVSGMGPSVLLPVGTRLENALDTIRPDAFPEDRPYVIANMVTSLDGAVTIDGTSGAVGDAAPGDQLVFRALRDQVDAVLTGTGTIAEERYGRLVPDEGRRATRKARGLEPDPLAVVLSRSGDLPEGVPLLDDPEQPVRTFTGDDADPEAALRVLRAEGIGVLLCEGGPSLLGDLIRRDLVDELYLTISPVLGGGTPERTLLAGDSDHPRRMELRWLLEQGGGLHARYAMLGRDPVAGANPMQGALPPR